MPKTTLLIREKVEACKTSLLDLSCKEGDEPLGNENMPELCELLGKNLQIKEVDLANNCVGDEGVILLARLSNIHTLILRGNPIGDDGAIALGGGQNTTLQRLDVSNCGITEQGAAALFCHPSIEWLSLRCNLVTDEGLVNLEKNAVLHYLDLYTNFISVKGAMSIAHNKSLQELYLDYNSINDDGAEYLAASTCIRVLALPHNGITSKGAVIIAQNSMIETLDLSSNELDDNCIVALEQMPKLRQLNLFENNITDLQAFSSCQHLQVNLGNNPKSQINLAILKSLSKKNDTEQANPSIIMRQPQQLSGDAEVGTLHKKGAKMQIIIIPQIHRNESRYTDKALQVQLGILKFFLRYKDELDKYLIMVEGLDATGITSNKEKYKNGFHYEAKKIFGDKGKNLNFAQNFKQQGIFETNLWSANEVALYTDLINGNYPAEKVPQEQLKKMKAHVNFDLCKTQSIPNYDSLYEKLFDDFLKGNTASIRGYYENQMRLIGANNHNGMALKLLTERREQQLIKLIESNIRNYRDTNQQNPESVVIIFGVAHLLPLLVLMRQGKGDDYMKSVRVLDPIKPINLQEDCENSNPRSAQHFLRIADQIGLPAILAGKQRANPPEHKGEEKNEKDENISTPSVTSASSCSSSSSSTTATSNNTSISTDINNNTQGSALTASLLSASLSGMLASNNSSTNINATITPVNNLAAVQKSTSPDFRAIFQK